MSNRIYEYAYHAGRYDAAEQMLEDDSSETWAQRVVDSAQERQEMSPLHTPPELEQFDMVVDLDEHFGDDE